LKRRSRRRIRCDLVIIQRGIAERQPADLDDISAAIDWCQKAITSGDGNLLIDADTRIINIQLNCILTGRNDPDPPTGVPFR